MKKEKSFLQRMISKLDSKLEEKSKKCCCACECQDKEEKEE